MKTIKVKELLESLQKLVDNDPEIAEYDVYLDSTMLTQSVPIIGTPMVDDMGSETVWLMEGGSDEIQRLTKFYQENFCPVIDASWGSDEVGLEEQRFKDWLDKEKANGLTKFHFTPDKTHSKEEVYKQLNASVAIDH